MQISRRGFNASLLALGATSLLSGCSVNPATGQSSFTGMLSVEDEIKMGKSEHPKLLKSFGGEYDDPRLAAYIREIGWVLGLNTEMGENLKYNFTVLNSDIINAFAAPGGYIYITRGLLAIANDEAEMAGVLAHELGHINARHIAQRYSQTMLANIGLFGLAILTGSSDIANMGGQLAGMALQSYSREQEFEADLLGVRYMSRAGYDPNAMVRFLSTLRRHSILQARMNGQPEDSVDELHMMATHPRTIDRVEKAMLEAKVTMPDKPLLNRTRYFKSINGMIFGDAIEQGVIRDRTFIHPDLRFKFDIPPRFILNNTPEQVIVRHKDGAIIAFDMGRMRGSSLKSYLTREWAKTSLSDVENIEINGQDAATGTTRGQTKQGQSVDVRYLAIEGDKDQVFQFRFITPPKLTSRFAEDFKRLTYSFKRISREEAAIIKPKRLIVVPVGRNDSQESLAAHLPYGVLNKDWFLMMNNLDPQAPLKPGEEVKVIAA